MGDDSRREQCRQYSHLQYHHRSRRAVALGRASCHRRHRSRQFALLVCGEIVPKSYGLGNAEEWSLWMVKPLTAVERVLYPLVFIFDGLTRKISAMLGGDEHIEEPYTDDASS
ncbi:MAG: DUF21 domain-containing protein [Haloarculaceae archaeon]